MVTNKTNKKRNWRKTYERKFSEIDRKTWELSQLQTKFNEFIQEFYNAVVTTMQDNYSKCSTKDKNYLDTTKEFLEKAYSHIIKLK